MNTKRIIFWIGFIIVLILIIWGLIVAMNKPPVSTTLGTPTTVTTTDHVRGSATSTVTLIEYSDFQCPACAYFYPMVERLMAESATGTLQLVYRNFPLPQHANAMISAQAAGAAGKQGKFWEMHNLLFDNQLAWQDLSQSAARSLFTTYATQIGLDVALFGADIDSPEVIAKINADQQGGVSLGINSTPTFFVNGKAIVNPTSYEAFKTLIDEAAQNSSQ